MSQSDAEVTWLATRWSPAFDRITQGHTARPAVQYSRPSSHKCNSLSRDRKLSWPCSPGLEGRPGPQGTLALHQSLGHSWNILNVGPDPRPWTSSSVGATSTSSWATELLRHYSHQTFFLKGLGFHFLVWMELCWGRKSPSVLSLTVGHQGPPSHWPPQKINWNKKIYLRSYFKVIKDFKTVLRPTSGFTTQQLKKTEVPPVIRPGSGFSGRRNQRGRT